MKLGIKIFECTVFYSFLRMTICPTIAGEAIVSAQLLAVGGKSTPNGKTQEFVVQPHCATVEGLIDRDAFPDNYDVEVLTDKGKHRINCAALVEAERQEYARSHMGDFLSIVDGWRAKNPSRKPRILDIGGRARSGYLLAGSLPGCDVTVLDVIADKGVDVVADIHSMSRTIEAESFDFLISVSVFEHLVMPWKAAIEINKVLRRDGAALIVTHQTVGMHDMPWDYYRFSDESWKGLFNGATGFEIVSTAMDDFVRIVPAHYFRAFKGYEDAGGFCSSSVIVRKTGSTQLSWPVEMASIVSTMYPE